MQLSVYTRHSLSTAVPSNQEVTPITVVVMPLQAIRWRKPNSRTRFKLKF